MKISPTYLTTLSTRVSLIALVALCIIFQIKHDDLSPPFTTRLQVVSRTLLPEKLLPYVTFGFRNMITDYYWISAVQDFTAWDKKDTTYFNYFKNISTLDPKFEYPYLFTILIIPTRKNIDMLNDVAALSDRGLTAIPTSWKIPFYLATQYYLFTKKLHPSEEYLKIAAHIEGAPDGVYLMYSAFAGNNVAVNDFGFKTSKNLLKVIADNTDNETIKKIAKSGLQQEAIRVMLEKGIVAYNHRHGRYPVSIDEMSRERLINLPEMFSTLFSVTISPRDGTFTVVEK